MDLRQDLSTDSCQYVVLSFADGTSLANTNPFSIAAELRRLVGDVEAAKPTSTGHLRIKTKTKNQALKLLAQDRFMDRPASFDYPDILNSVEAFAYAPSLTEVTEDELLRELKTQGVIGITRLRPKSGKANPGIRFRFRGQTSPPELRAGFEDIPLRPWRRSPLLCRRCAAYGHPAKHCRSETLRCLRCSGSHCTDDCDSGALLCPHCEERHAAWDRRCAVLAAFFAKQDGASQNTAHQELVRKKTDAATQTKLAFKTSVASGPHQPTTRLIEIQTDDLPVLAGMATLIQEEEDPEDHSTSGHRLDHRNFHQQEETELPPAARTRSSCQTITRPIATGAQLEPTTESDRPELNDPDLLPKTKKPNRPDDEHCHHFKYEDGTEPLRTVTRLYRYEAAVRVVDLDLRPGTKAHRAASRGFYFDRSFGRRLYLQMT